MSEKNVGRTLKCLPKLSYVLLSHNREKYIRQAIESAFAQDYEGELEYIFSDDCSTDRTFEIIKECVASYIGNRRVVVTQTPHNMHLAGNTNHAVQFATGDFVIRADDDDLSTVDRCSQIGRAIAEHPGCSYVFANHKKFTDKDERQIVKLCSRPDELVQARKIYKLKDAVAAIDHFRRDGCLHQAWSLKVYKIFGSLPIEGYYVDDVMCHYRAVVLGDGVYIPSTLAYIRKASMNMSSGEDDGQRGYSSIIRKEKFYDKYMHITYAPLKATINTIVSYLKDTTPEDVHIAQPFFDMLNEDMRKRAILRSYWRKGTINRFRIRRLMKYRGLYPLLRCLPMPIFAALLAMRCILTAFRCRG